MSVGGLEDFDEEEAAQNLADVYTNAEALASQQPEAPAAAVPAPAVVPEVQQGGSEPIGAHTPAEAGSTPAPATAAPEIQGALPGIPEPPPPPELTNDPQENVRRQVDYHRRLVEHGQALRGHQERLNKAAAGVSAEQARKERDAATAAADAKAKEIKRYADERAQRQGLIDSAVKERADAAGDLGAANWMERNSGAALVATIFGAFSAGLRNRSAALLGQAGNAENEATKTIDRIMQREYAQRKSRYDRAGASIMEARYGFKDAAENHRAAMNDLDADMAAKYRLIAKEAEERMKALGADQKTVEGSMLRNDALTKEAEYEAKIHDREEGHQVARENAAANQAIARASLSLRRSEFDEKRDRQAAEDTRKADKATVFDAAGKPLGQIEDDKQRSEVNGAIVSGRDIIRLTRELQKDVAKGATLGPLTEAGRLREGKRNALLLQVKELEKLGVLTGPDVGLVEGIIGGPKSTALGITGPQLQQMESMVKARVRGALARGGLDPNATDRALGSGGGAKKAPDPSKAPTADMVTIRNAKTGETKQVTREEARRLGALK